ncbi:MAG: hypothetical protein JRH06_04405 [Deltaproteobacteria bacterium]|nr:hypothetical protein [Deltaproteobacteria bacterium]
MEEDQGFRSDSAAYQAEVINYCQSKGIKFAIGGDVDKAVVKGIREIREEEWKPYQNGYIAETGHCMNGTDEAYRLVVIGRPYQGKLFGEEEACEKYTA